MEEELAELDAREFDEPSEDLEARDYDEELEARDHEEPSDEDVDSHADGLRESRRRAHEARELSDEDSAELERRMYRHTTFPSAKGVNLVAANLRLSRRRGHEARSLADLD